MTASRGTSLQWKLTFQDARRRRIVLFVVTAITTASVCVILAVSVDSCGLDHMMIVRGLENYETTLDPEFCADLLDQIYEFNDSCNAQVEIIDCG